MIEFRFFFFSNISIQCYTFPSKHCFCCTPQILNIVFLTQNILQFSLRFLLWPICYLEVCMLLQSCPTLCDPIDVSPPGSPNPGILQARTLEWVAISFNAWKWKVKVKSLSCVQLFETPRTAAYQAPLPMGFSRLLCPWDSPGKSTGVGYCLSVLYIAVCIY